MYIFADEPPGLTDILKQSFLFKWNFFADFVLPVYPNLKKFAIDTSMQYNFGKIQATDKVELSFKRALKGLGKRVKSQVEWDRISFSCCRNFTDVYFSG